MIPTFLHKLAILIHVPQLKSLLINPYYSRRELFDLEVYQEFYGNVSEIDKELKKARRYFNMNQLVMLDNSLKNLTILAR